MSSSANGGRKTYRGGRSRGRGGRRGGGRGGGRATFNRRSPNISRNSLHNFDIDKNYMNDASTHDSKNRLQEMKDEDVLIAFMPYMKCCNKEAISIHGAYQSKGDQQAFLKAAREFLFREKSKNKNKFKDNQSSNLTDADDSSQLLQSTSLPNLPKSTTNVSTNKNTESDPMENHPSGRETNIQTQSDINQLDTITCKQHQQQNLEKGLASPNMEMLERKIASLISEDDNAAKMSCQSIESQPAINETGSISISENSSSPLFPSTNLTTQSYHQSTLHHPHYEQQQQQQQNTIGFQPASDSDALSQIMQEPRTCDLPTNILSSLFNTSNVSNRRLVHDIPQENSRFQQNAATSSNTSDWPSSISPSFKHNGPGTHLPPPGLSSSSETLTRQPNFTDNSSHSPTKIPKDLRGSLLRETPTKEAAAEGTHTKPKYQPKRLWTRMEEQPGKILANNHEARIGLVIDLRPRQELTARWMLPIRYLEKHTQGKDIQSVRDLLKYLSIGLFRRGSTENGFPASIISKEILCPEGESRDDYPFRVVDDMVVGTVPFYSPRTPGHVVFRLYWRENPVYTLASGPTLRIRIIENDFESSVRFILSNFKGKKVNPTSLSSLNSLSLVLESFQITSKKPALALQHQFESAGRAVWGCVCESRKIIDACGIDYQRTSAKLLKLEEEIKDLREKVAEEEKEENEEKFVKETTCTDDESALKSVKSLDSSEISLNVALLREKTKAFMGGRASCERKWRDSQLAFSSILRAVVKNPSITLLLRPDLIAKLSLEFELWCPLCEEFAVPQGFAHHDNNIMWYEPLKKISQPITTHHFRICFDARAKHQMKTLGFIPNTIRLENILYSNRGNKRQMDPGAVSVFNKLSTSMGQLYQNEYFTADSIFHQREAIRAKVEKLVRICECFPVGTKVAIFGSSANGYGSPKSDLDMCLQVPQTSSVAEESTAGSEAKMATIAQMFEKNHLLDVDTSRLSARIPVIQFNYPRENKDAPIMECDLSMHNPLAVLNTSLLRTYAEINPVSRVMSSVIKRWAKARDINNPARHTLSSYGYILMLLHFLTYHCKSDDGLILPLNNDAIPLLPNLQWMDSRWPGSASSAPYTEFREPPKQPMQHPREENVTVNSYFYRSNEAEFHQLKRLFPGQDLSLGILLASFFRYYAYDFDYKRHVVSLNSTKRYGIVEREVKAELDGFTHRRTLTIEDPFETSYDVAHVLRGGYYHRIRREFAVAYSKIVDVASGKSRSTYDNQVVDLTNMSGSQLIDWICEQDVSPA